MPLVVKVIAHTKFLGVPSDLLPMSEAEATLSPEEKDGDGILYRARALLGEKKGQDQGTEAERLVECAGRVCYDSYMKGRPSKEYHEHIMDVDHGSVTEHVTLTFFLSGISRGLTHELVRHRVGVAISQRSTRYVDESESQWVMHPLEAAWLKAHGVTGDMMSNDPAVTGARDRYRQLVATLEGWLVANGTDKLTARKQARGAARGYLGNALMTEMIWTCNLRTLRSVVLKQRAGGAADAEIRLLANRLYEEALPYWPTYLGRFQKRACPDGIGYELYLPDPKDAEIQRLKDQIKALAPDPTEVAPAPTMSGVEMMPTTIPKGQQHP